MTPGQHPDLDELILYLMGTLDATAADREAMDRVRLHLKECSECRAQVAQMRTDLALAAMAVPQIAPPSGAKERLFQVAGLDLTHTVKPTVPANVIPMKQRRTNPALIWGGWLAAAACLLYAVQIRESNQGMRRQLRVETAEIVQSSESSARARQVLDLLSSPQAQRVTLVAAHSTPVPTGHAVYLPNRGALVFTASNLAPLPANKTYELWVIPANGTAPVPAGTFQPDARGMASVLLPKLPRGIQAKAFGVTMENSGGAATPTLPILLAGG
jgi:anti-sigma-K factor RskA